MARFIGYDQDNIPRVFGEHENADVAETWCREDLTEWTKRRHVALNGCRVERADD